MAREVNRFKLGLVVVVSFVLMIATLLWLGATKYWEKNILMVTYMNESVQGLEKGSLVRYRGVAIGSVKSIGIAPDGKLIEIILKIKANTKIPIEELQKKYARLEMAGITGMKFINLAPLARKDALISTPPLKLSFQPKYPLIPSKPSGIKEITLSLTKIYKRLMSLDIEGIAVRVKSSLEKINNVVGQIKMDKILENVEKTTKGTALLLNDKSMKKIINNVEIITEKLAATSTRLEQFMAAKDIDATLHNVRETTKNLAKITEQAKKSVEGAPIRKTLKEINRLVKNVNQLVLKAKDTNKELKRALLETQKSLKSFRKDFHRMEYNVGNSTLNLNDTLHSIKRLAELLERDPASLLRGRVGK